MRLNETTVVCGDRVILVPYRAEHVPTYHTWMQSPELLQLTASEPLTLEEEYDMQRKWHEDDDKLTFIILERPSHLPASTHPVLSATQVVQGRMVGDVNMFLPNGPGEDGECEIMIASPHDRRKGFAHEALSLFLSYATTTLPIAATHLIARIGTSNTPSIALFARLGFEVVRAVPVWDEVEMRFGGVPSSPPSDSVVRELSPGGPDPLRADAYAEAQHGQAKRDAGGVGAEVQRPSGGPIALWQEVDLRDRIGVWALA